MPSSTIADALAQFSQACGRFWAISEAMAAAKQKPIGGR